MKFFHAATLMVAGWSLMLPPTSRTLRLDMTRDLAKWDVRSTHATAAECEQEKARLVASMTDSAATKSSLRRPGRDLLATRYRHARCISSEDPALKAKMDQSTKSD